MKKFILLFFVSALLIPQIVFAASFYFSPSSGSYHRNENFTVSVFINAESAVNAVQGTVKFPTKYLDVISVHKVNGVKSIIDLWVESPSFSNATEIGNISFEGIILNPGFTGTKGKLFDIVFRAKEEGVTAVHLTEFAILANDGLGTNISSTGKIASFSILPEHVFLQKESEDIKNIESKVKEVEEWIISVEAQQKSWRDPSLIEDSFLSFWNILPYWVKVSMLSLIGIVAVVLAFIVILFGMVMFVWSRGFILRNKG